MDLRPYQREAIDAVLAYWANGGGNPLVDMATGTGKSVVIGTLTRELLTTWPDMRVLMLVHVKELVEQNARALLRTWPQAPIGINSAGLGRRDLRSQILFASIQSVFRQDGYSLGPRDLILIDEAHLVPRAGEGMYRTLLYKLRERVPDLRVAGFTATPYRLDTGRLDRGEDDSRLFSEIVYSYGIGRGIADGYLSPLVSKATMTTLDVGGVAKRGGEFVPGELERAVDKISITRAAVKELIAFGEHRRSWLVFASGVDHAEHLRDEIRSYGIACETVTGETPKGERDRIIRDFREGRLRCLTNAQVLTTGFDAPMVDMIAMLRPTLSVGLYVQICGRGTRLSPGKENCLVLDYAGNVRRHGPVDAVTIREPGEGTGIAPVKECPDCASLIHTSHRECPHCGYLFPPSEETKLEAAADAVSPIMSKALPSWHDVSDVRLYRHHKEGSPLSMRVEFACGLSVYRQWVCFEHTGFAKSKAHAWWQRMGGRSPSPASVEEALQRARELRLPDQIQVRPSGKFFEVVGYRHTEASAA
jgi:DNA repair protein RadD